jgi:N-acetylated-alpha-linked acidic dipeptidase
LSRSLSVVLACVLTLSPVAPSQETPTTPAPFNPPDKIFGFHDATAELKAEKIFLAVPDPMEAKKNLQTLTAVPHVAGSAEDHRTAEYVLSKYQEAGLDAHIEEYKIWMGLPIDIRVDLVEPEAVTMHGPSPERVTDDLFQKDPRILPAFNEYSANGDVTADVVYANYGRAEDFQKLKDLGVDLKGKIVIVRSGETCRGVIIYSDPQDDGYVKGDPYPKGPWRPATGVQRGSVQYLFRYPGDPTTPGIASTMDLPESKRTPPDKATDLARIPITPLSYADASPIMQNLGGPESPRSWQGGLPFTYHIGPGPAKARMTVKIAYRYTTIWDVVGMVKGTQWPNEWIISGNHRDAWAFGAVDPNSGTASQLEAVRGIGELLKTGWKPKRTMVFCSWDAEEEGLIGSTEYAEKHVQELSHAVAYFNMDVAVAGPNFGSSAVPSLKQYMRDVTKSVPSPKGGSVYDQWKVSQDKDKDDEKSDNRRDQALTGTPEDKSNATVTKDVHVGDLGSGSDYTAFLQHLGVPSVDMGSKGPYGVYHSAFDNFEYFTKFTDPTFVYEQEMARVYGLALMRMASTEVLPMNYEEYGKEISEYLKTADTKSKAAFGNQAPSFADAESAAAHITKAGADLMKMQTDFKGDPGIVNLILRNTERMFLIDGLPDRPWFKHAIYAPGEHTGYAAVVIPGVNEAIEGKDLALTKQQLQVLTTALNRAAGALESTH